MSSKHEPVQGEDGRWVMDATYHAASNAAHDIARLLNARLGCDLGPTRDRIIAAIDEVVANQDV